MKRISFVVRLKHCYEYSVSLRISSHQTVSLYSKYEHVKTDFGKIRFSVAAKRKGAKNSKKTSIVSKTESIKKSDLKNKSKVREQRAYAHFVSLVHRKILTL